MCLLAQLENIGITVGEVWSQCSQLSHQGQCRDSKWIIGIKGVFGNSEKISPREITGTYRLALTLVYHIRTQVTLSWSLYVVYHGWCSPLRGVQSLTLNPTKL